MIERSSDTTFDSTDPNEIKVSMLVLLLSTSIGAPLYTSAEAHEPVHPCFDRFLAGEEECSQIEQDKNATIMRKGN